MRQQLQRLARIERVREIARQTAARDAGEAEAARAQLTTLADRTAHLAADYARAGEATDGAALARATRFAGSLQDLRHRTGDDAARATAVADERLATLAEAERRRAVIEERIAALRTQLATRTQRPALVARRRWHDA